MSGISQQKTNNLPSGYCKTICFFDDQAKTYSLAGKFWFIRCVHQTLHLQMSMYFGLYKILLMEKISIPWLRAPGTGHSWGLVGRLGRILNPGFVGFYEGGHTNFLLPICHLLLHPSLSLPWQQPPARRFSSWWFIHSLSCIYWASSTKATAHTAITMCQLYSRIISHSSITIVVQVGIIIIFAIPSL